MFVTVVSILAVVIALIVLLGTTPVFTSGSVTFVTFTPAGGSLQSLNVTDHSWAEMIDAIDVTHTGSGGVQALLAGILRGDGNVKAFADSANKFYNSTYKIRVGTKGVFQVSVDGTNYYQVPGMIKKVNSQAAIAGGVQYDFDISLDSTAGSYVYPS